MTIALFTLSLLLEVAVGPPSVKIFERTVDNYMSVFAVENAIGAIITASALTLTEYTYTVWGKWCERRKTAIKNS